MQFNMEYSSKIPALAGSKIRIFLFISFILLGIMPVFTGLLQKTMADAVSRDVFTDRSNNLVFFNGNTLSSVSASIYPGYSSPRTRKIPVIATAYSSTVWQTDDTPFVTAAGTWVREGVIANNKLPFGTKILIPEIYGDKVFIVEDRMNQKKSDYHIDIWFSSYWEALNFGVKKTYIEVVES